MKLHPIMISFLSEFSEQHKNKKIAIFNAQLALFWFQIRCIFNTNFKFEKSGGLDESFLIQTRISFPILN